MKAHILRELDRLRSLGLAVWRAVGGQQIAGLGGRQHAGLDHRAKRAVSAAARRQQRLAQAMRGKPGPKFIALQPVGHIVNDPQVRLAPVFKSLAQRCVHITRIGQSVDGHPKLDRQRAHLTHAVSLTLGPGDAIAARRSAERTEPKHAAAVGGGKAQRVLLGQQRLSHPAQPTHLHHARPRR